MYLQVLFTVQKVHLNIFGTQLPYMLCLPHIKDKAVNIFTATLSARHPIKQVTLGPHSVKSFIRMWVVRTLLQSMSAANPLDGLKLMVIWIFLQLGVHVSE